MHYYIDGYNLLFRIFGPKDYQLRTQREKLIHTLREKIQFLDLNVTLVFDSHYFEGDESRTRLDNFAIVFTRQGETADEYILAQLEITSQPRQEIVVTSDRPLGAMARRCGAKTELVEEFIQWLYHRYKKRRQQAKKAILPVSKPPVVLAPKQLVVPSPFLSPDIPEQAFDYYLAEFEKRLQAEDSLVISKPKAIKKGAKKGSKKVKLRQESEENPMSEMERWLKLFERNLQQENEL